MSKKDNSGDDDFQNSELIENSQKKTEVRVEEGVAGLKKFEWQDFQRQPTYS
jgi:hypothetical protein